MAQGGKRKGAGRKKGSKSVRLAKRAVDICQERGVSPIEVLLDVMIDARDDYKALLDKGILTDEEIAEGRRLQNLALDAASKAAPYVHPKLQATVVKQTDEKMGHEDALDLIAADMKENANDGGNDG